MTGAAKLTSAVFNSAAKLGGIFKPAWKILTYGAGSMVLPENSLCISIERGALSAAYGSQVLSHLKIKGAKTYQYEGYPQPGEAASSAILAVSELKAERAQVTLGIPKEWAVIRAAEMPLAVRENLPDVVARELDRLTPLNAEDTFYDFRVLSEDDGKLTILLAVVKADLVNGYIEALKGKNIVVSCVTVNLSGIGSLLNYTDRNKDCVYLEISNDKYEGALFINGFLREVLTGDLNEADDASKIETIMTEITPLADAARKAGRFPQFMFSLKNMAPSFGELLKLKANIPVKLLGENGIKLSIPGVNALPYYAVGGVMERLSHNAAGLNLLTKGVHERQKTPLAFTAILLLIIVALGFLSMIMPLKNEEKRLAKIESELSLRKKEVNKFERLAKEIKEVEKEISDMKSFREGRQPSVDIIREITSLLPQNAWLTRMHVSGTAAEIEGFAESATGLLPKLEASGYFHKVEFASQTVRDSKKGVDRFNIRMKIEGAKETETANDAGGEGLTNEGF
ncbi:MAG: hypothetical protein C4560_03625 [Nitrospiraceae bacterium]|nr:MAG: hypothetical protein C4560_03625 [Nitrospiraceae bacterium]